MKDYGDSFTEYGYKGGRDGGPLDPRRERKRWKKDPEGENTVHSLKSLNKGCGYTDSRGAKNAVFEKMMKSNVGRPWNTVYSEICDKNTKPYVRSLVDESIHYLMKWSAYGDYYFVDVSGILRYCPMRTYNYERTPKKPGLIDGKYGKAKSGIWYEYIMFEIGDVLADSERMYVDSAMGDLLRQMVSDGIVRGRRFHESWSEYLQGQFRSISIPVKRVQLNKREIRRHNLNARLAEMTK